MTRPLKEAEKALKEAAKPQIIEARTRLKAAQSAAEKAANKVITDDTAEALAEAVDTAQAAEGIVIPPEPELIMAEQGGRVAVLAPEGGIIGTLAGRYSGMPNFDVFLRGHGGDDLKVGRKSRDKEEVQRATLTMGLCLQPGVLRELRRIPGAADKGLLARILYSLPDDNVGYRNPDPAPVPDDVQQQYGTNIRALTMTLYDIPEHHTIPFHPDASRMMTALIAEAETRLRPDGEWAHIRDWGNKWAGSVVGRIAGLLHMAEHLRDGWARPITVDTVTRAVRIGQYFATHALAVFDHMGADPLTGHADAALDWIKRSGRPQFTTRELWRGIYRGRFAAVKELDPVLDLLEQHGFIKALPDHERARKGGRAPSPRYLAHPSLARPALTAVPGTGQAGTA
jgi:hypothetical protein